MGSEVASPPACVCSDSDPVNLADWWRIGVGAVIAVNSMMVSVAVDVSDVSEVERSVIYGILALLAGVAIALFGPRLTANAVRELRNGHLTIEAMFIAGIVAAMCASAVAALTGVGDAYFEVVAILLVVYSLGQQLTRQARDRALRSTLQWMPELTRCQVLDDEGSPHEVLIDEVKAGDLVRVEPGSTIAVDGIVDRGEAFVREAEMTGEHFAVTKRVGSKVWAGTHCLDAMLVVRATVGGGERRVDKIVEAVERACNNPARIQSQVDRVAQLFLPIVALIALVTFVLWGFIESWTVALFNSMAVLLIACPCALGLATPLALWAALGRLANRGLLVRGADAIERLAQIDIAAFDKTGTLTDSRTSILEIFVEPPEGMARDTLLTMVRHIEKATNHPIADAFARLEIREEDKVEILELHNQPGVGVDARVRLSTNDTEHKLRIGVLDSLFAPDDQDARRLTERIKTPTQDHRIAALLDDRPVLVARVSEQLHSSWGESLVELRNLGLSTIVMTGDIEQRAKPSGADRVLAMMSPEDKREEVERLIGEGHRVLFVGDGVNDASALAVSHVGVGLTSGAELAAEVGDIAWYGSDLLTIPWAISVSREALSTVRGSLVLALAYNVVGLTVAAAGWLHPVAATLLMTCSSLVVTWRSLTILGDEQEEIEASPPTTTEYREEASTP
ncbi:MAG: cation-translocating P-type ATPase [bacterium]|nr:cation-translocating P-type ATPase [bacterium]